MTSKEESQDERFHLGANQRRILQLLEKRKSMTEREIATEIYGRPVEIGDYRYVSVSKSLRNLRKRGLLERTTAEVRWSLKRRKQKAKQEKPAGEST